MFPFRYSSIFRSRWIALFWAASIVWTAVDVAGMSARKRGTDGNTAAAPANAEMTDAGGASVDAEQLNQAQHLLDQFGR